MGEDEQKFSYTSQEQLKLLVALLAESSIELSAFMGATVPDEFRGLRDRIYEMRRTFRGKEELEQSEPLLERLIEQAREYKVLPFTSIRCDFAINGRPQIEPAYDFWRIDDPFFGGENPLAFVEGWRVSSICMTNARKKRDIKIIKETVIGIPTEKYTIRSISAGLDPRDYTSDHYFDGTDYSGHLNASDGTITLTGAAKVKGGFDQLLKKLAEMGIKPAQNLPTPTPELPAPRT